MLFDLLYKRGCCTFFLVQQPHFYCRRSVVFLFCVDTTYDTIVYYGREGSKYIDFNKEVYDKVS